MINKVNQRRRNTRKLLVVSSVLVLVSGLLAACSTNTANVQGAKQEAEVSTN